MSRDSRLLVEELFYFAAHGAVAGLRWFQIEQILIDAPSKPFARLKSAIQWALALDDGVLGSMIPPGRLRTDEARSFLEAVLEQVANYSDEYERSHLSWDAYRDRIENEHETIARLRASCCSPWLKVTAKYYNEMVGDAGRRRGEALAAWLRREFPRRFRCLGAAPIWVEVVPWPIARGQPLVFVGQLPLDGSGTGASYVYVFLDPTDDTTHTIVQRMDGRSEA